MLAAEGPQSVSWPPLMIRAHFARLSGWPLVRSSLCLALAASAVPLALACGGGEVSVSAGGSKAEEAPRSTEVQHEPCEGGGEAVDVNGDGKPDIRRVMAGGRETCRVTDLNRNGKPDLYQYFDGAGNLRRREADYDESGVVDAIEIYEGGKLARVEYDTLGRHRIDTWDFYDPATGKRVRRERDTHGSGRVDQWWTWEGEKVTIAFDRDGDGHPDPNDPIVLGDNGATQPKDAGPPPSTASQVGAMDAGSPTPAAQPVADPTPAPAAADAGAPKTKPRGKR